MVVQLHSQVITLDTRETKLIELFRQASIPFETANLPIGDIILKHTIDIKQAPAPAPTLAPAPAPAPTDALSKDRQITYEFIIERKCTQDMVASIKDGRYKEQKIRLLAESNNSTHERHIIIAYIIEGTPADLRSPADKTILLGSLISSTFRDRIAILQTYSLQDTFDLVVRMNERLGKDYADFFKLRNLGSLKTSSLTNLRNLGSLKTSSLTNLRNLGSLKTSSLTNAQELDNMPVLDNIPVLDNEINLDGGTGNSTSDGDACVSTRDCEVSYLAAIKKNKKDNMTPAMWNMNCLCGIPGISSAIAIKIAEKYSTIRSLLEAYQACTDCASRETLLAEIILTETNKQRRRIGNVISKRVYEYFQT